jgi:hypothetical protein
MARAIAAFVLSDTRMVSFVTNWNEAAYRRGSSSPRVRGSQFFTDVEQFANYLEGMMEMSGWTVEVLKQVRLV